jgi:hypothetical protein
MKEIVADTNKRSKLRISVKFLLLSHKIFRMFFISRSVKKDYSTINYGTRQIKFQRVLMAAWAAASLAMGTLKGEQDT